MSLIITVFAFLVAIGVLVTFHELGHYWAARWCDVKILRFSVGFGRPLRLWRRGTDQTEWVVAAIPLGGYVKMADERDGSAAPMDRARAFNGKPLWQRAFIILAGPFANLLLAAVLYWALFVIGTPGIKAYVALPQANSPAAAAGFAEFDLITAIDGKAVATWSDARLFFLEGAVQRTPVEVEVKEASGRLRSRTLDLSSVTKDDLDGDFLGKLGLGAYRGKSLPVVRTVEKGSPAERAGIKSGDALLGVNGLAIPNWEAFTAVVRGSGGREVMIKFDRAGERRSVIVVPDTVTEFGVPIGRVGITQKIEAISSDVLTTQVRYGPIESIGYAVAKVWDMSLFSLKMFGKMITGSVSWKNLSGPITIADYAGQAAQLGVLTYVDFLALISISLGILNLLPIPVLDGGQLMYHMAEFIKGSPLSDRTMEISQQIGLALLLGLTAFAFFNDVNRLL